MQTMREAKHHFHIADASAWAAKEIASLGCHGEHSAEGTQFLALAGKKHQHLHDHQSQTVVCYHLCTKRNRQKHDRGNTERRNFLLCRCSRQAAGSGVGSGQNPALLLVFHLTANFTPTFLTPRPLDLFSHRLFFHSLEWLGMHRESTVTKCR